MFGICYSHLFECIQNPSLTIQELTNKFVLLEDTHFIGEPDILKKILLYRQDELVFTSFLVKF